MVAAVVVKCKQRIAVVVELNNIILVAMEEEMLTFYNSVRFMKSVMLFL